MLLGLGRGEPIEGRAVAITGMGAVTCAGIGIEALWEQLLAPNKTGRLRSVEDFDPSAFFGPKEARRLDRFAQMSVAAAEMARADAGDLGADPDRCGVIFASGVGGFNTLVSQVLLCEAKGPERVSPFLVPMMMVNAAAANVSMRFGWHGPSESIVTACASGTHAVTAAARLVASGRCDVAVGGGGESAIQEVAIGAFSNMTTLSPTGISRPFDVARDGFVLAEGAAALVLEDKERALARGARIYAEIAGGASTVDAHHITAPDPEGAQAVSCMELALEDAGLSAGDVGQINAHGTSTQLNDLAEARAIAKLFGDSIPPVTANKGLLGHSLGAAGAIEAIASALSIHHGLIPPTAGLERLDPEIEVDVVTGQPRPFPPGPVLSNSFGFGGHNGCLVLVPTG
ncbi:MAG: beta-ketoacyl-[acyl-carrier-protein] synthase family protein [Acidimicrobiales bacterium]